MKICAVKTMAYNVCDVLVSVHVSYRDNQRRQVLDYRWYLCAGLHIFGST